MRVFPAAVFSNGYMRGQARYRKLNDAEKHVVDTLPQSLESYHYIKTQRYVDSIREHGLKILLDSGAFSAHTLGAHIDLNEYVQYILRNEDIIERSETGQLFAVVLDAIDNAQHTYENQKAMERLGVTPIPCYHQGEPEHYLETYVREYEFIMLGGMVGVATPQLMRWLDRVWERYLVDGSGAPRCRVHGLGMTSVELMDRYPWYSVDSSSWIQSASFGSVITMDMGTLSVSAKSPSRKMERAHVTTLPGIERDVVERNLAESGFDVQRLADVYEARAVYNLRTFKLWEQRLNARHGSPTFKAVRQELF